MPDLYGLSFCFINDYIFAIAYPNSRYINAMFMSAKPASGGQARVGGDPNSRYINAMFMSAKPASGGQARVGGGGKKTSYSLYYFYRSRKIVANPIFY